MGFREDSRIDGTREITFLYRLMAGMATESFGIECARLAGLPEKILKVAADRSQSFQSTVQERVKQNRCALIPLLFRCCVCVCRSVFFFQDREVCPASSPMPDCRGFGGGFRCPRTSNIGRVHVNNGPYYRRLLEARRL